MTATNHVITGAVIALAIHNPAIALPVAFASHFVLDALPHFGDSHAEYKSRRFGVYLTADIFLASFLLLIIAITRLDQWPLMLAGAVSAASPDLMWLPHYIRSLRGQKTQIFNAIEKFHDVIQWSQSRWGLGVEAIWFLAFLTLINNLLR